MNILQLHLRSIPMDWLSLGIDGQIESLSISVGSG